MILYTPSSASQLSNTTLTKGLNAWLYGGLCVSEVQPSVPAIFTPMALKRTHSFIVREDAIKTPVCFLPLREQNV